MQVLLVYMAIPISILPIKENDDKRIRSIHMQKPNSRRRQIGRDNIQKMV